MVQDGYYVPRGAIELEQKSVTIWNLQCRQEKRNVDRVVPEVMFKREKKYKARQGLPPYLLEASS